MASSVRGWGAKNVRFSVSFETLPKVTGNTLKPVLIPVPKSTHLNGLRFVACGTVSKPPESAQRAKCQVRLLGLQELAKMRRFWRAFHAQKCQAEKCQVGLHRNLTFARSGHRAWENHAALKTRLNQYATATIK